MRLIQARASLVDRTLGLAIVLGLGGAAAHLVE